MDIDVDVWILLINNTDLSDTDLYICEVNGVSARKYFFSLEGNLTK